MSKSKSNGHRRRKASGGAAELRSRIAKLRVRRNSMVPAKDAVAVVDDILAAGTRISTRSRRLRAEIRRLSEFIHAARAGIVTVKTDEVKKEFIPTATDELDAIIEATAVATNAIMDATEMVDKVMGSLQGDAGTRLMEATTKIYEACGFQDITGQRITKVVKTLKQIEERVDAMDAAFADEGRAPAVKTAGLAKAKSTDSAVPKVIADADLLNGPQLKKAAKSQDDIDALLFGPG
ncbi:MAG: protein phosphatase CheZ [Pseudomonadota bacterium]